MTTDIVVWPGKANLTIPVTTMPTVFDLEQAGKATHAAFTITTAELRALAVQTARAVEQLDQALAESGGHMNRLEHP